jgi:hypothetical protein
MPAHGRCVRRFSGRNGRAARAHHAHAGTQPALLAPDQARLISRWALGSAGEESGVHQRRLGPRGGTRPMAPALCGARQRQANAARGARTAFSAAEPWCSWAAWADEFVWLRCGAQCLTGRTMRRVIGLLVIWLLAIAVPAQGLAAATMLAIRWPARAKGSISTGLAEPRPAGGQGDTRVAPIWFQARRAQVRKPAWMSLRSGVKKLR